MKKERIINYTKWLKNSGVNINRMSRQELQESLKHMTPIANRLLTRLKNQHRMGDISSNPMVLQEWKHERHGILGLGNDFRFKYTAKDKSENSDINELRFKYNLVRRFMLAQTSRLNPVKIQIGEEIYDIKGVKGVIEEFRKNVLKGSDYETQSIHEIDENFENYWRLYNRAVYDSDLRTDLSYSSTQLQEMTYDFMQQFKSMYDSSDYANEDEYIDELYKRYKEEHKNDYRHNIDADKDVEDDFSTGERK